MADLLPERKISHRIWKALGVKKAEIKKGLAKGQGFAAPAEIREKRTAVIIRKADPYPVMALMDRLKGLPIKGHTDFFVFARLTAGELQEVEKFAEVDRIFLDEPLTAYLDQAVETTKAKASWNTFEHYGEGITWAVVDSGINDLHPHFGGDAVLAGARPFSHLVARDPDAERLVSTDSRRSAQD